MSSRPTRTPGPMFGPSYSLLDEIIEVSRRNPGGPQLIPRDTTFAENATDFFTPYIGKDTSRRIFGGASPGSGTGAFGQPKSGILNFLDNAGLANILPLTAGAMLGGQAVKDLRAGNYSDAALNTGLAGLELMLSGRGAKQLYQNALLRNPKRPLKNITLSTGGQFDQTSARPAKSLKSQEKIPDYDDAAHYMRVNEMRGNMLLPPSAIMPETYIPSRFDRLGVHVGTPQQAADRFNFQANEGYRQGQTFPLKIRTDKPFEIKDFEEFGIKPDLRFDMTEVIDGKTVLTEDGVREVMNAYADAKNVNLEDGVDLFRKELTDKGYTNIPYVNLIEGMDRSAGGVMETYRAGLDDVFTKENISNIMLVDRTAKDPAVIKSRFAKFKDVYDPNIMAGLAGLGLLSQIENEEGE